MNECYCKGEAPHIGKTCKRRCQQLHDLVNNEQDCSAGHVLKRKRYVILAQFMNQSSDHVERQHFRFQIIFGIRTIRPTDNTNYEEDRDGERLIR
ncbi:hypothetical protein P5673_023102 [Acropora cervicornis]|uniref:Uncharacterized protein n=1 Tax=Acropora cervicornis TaxID=6130 RepID=A0AAD9Q5G0_ACRCE|nr:hypothetical protein P5673_023102 [Acropora cervicornis]